MKIGSSGVIVWTQAYVRVDEHLWIHVDFDCFINFKINILNFIHLHSNIDEMIWCRHILNSWLHTTGIEREQWWFFFLDSWMESADVHTWKDKKKQIETGTLIAKSK